MQSKYEWQLQLCHAQAEPSAKLRTELLQKASMEYQASGDMGPLQPDAPTNSVRSLLNALLLKPVPNQVPSPSPSPSPSAPTQLQLLKFLFAAQCQYLESVVIPLESGIHSS